MTRQRRFFASSEGCGFILLTCLVSCAALLVNVAVFSGVYTYLEALGPDWLDQPRIEQSIKLIAPVLMLVVEWRLFDLLTDMFAGKTSDDGKA
jgi:hypothetical protein